MGGEEMALSYQNELENEILELYSKINNTKTKQIIILLLFQPIIRNITIRRMFLHLVAHQQHSFHL